MLGNTIHNRKSRNRVLVCSRLTLGILVVAWRNGVGLCWEATPQGIAKSGRENDLAGPEAPNLRPS